MKLDAVIQVHALLSHSQFLWIINPDMQLVLFDSDPNVTLSLSSVDFLRSQGVL